MLRDVRGEYLDVAKEFRLLGDFPIVEANYRCFPTSSDQNHYPKRPSLVLKTG